MKDDYLANKLVNSIAGRLSLRSPLHESLEILARVTEITKLSKDIDLKNVLSIIQSEFSTVGEFEHDFISLCFAIATGVGKTRLMGAFISYLHIEHGINHFFVLAPNLTIYNKLIADFTPNTPKYVFKGIAEFAINVPNIITGDNYESGAAARFGDLLNASIDINIFNISKINSDKDKKSGIPKIKRLRECIGQSYFDYLSGLKDLVLLMDESHRYRASAGMKAINNLNPILGLELTATPFVESAKGRLHFKNIIFNYPLANAMKDGFIKEPAVVTQKNFNPVGFSDEELEKIKLQDGIRLHENTKVELETFARNTGNKIVKPFVLVIASGTEHAGRLQILLEQESFFEGRYKGKVAQVHSGQSGEEKEENIERLLAVEKVDEPTEIVIHVNMLKEGWDVTNLYTIIPLRKANSHQLVEQSIGRGLRLPYGKRTGVASVDRLNIVAHDKFQEIIDEASRSDSPIHLAKIEIENSTDYKKPKTIICIPNSSHVEPLFSNPTEQKFAASVLQVISNHEDLPSSDYLSNDESYEMYVNEAQAIYNADDMLPGIEHEIDHAAITKKVIQEYTNNTIDISRIIVIPKGDNSISYTDFKLDCSSIRFMPVDNEVLIQYLSDGKQETLSFSHKDDTEQSYEDYIVRGLTDFDDISYDEHSAILYSLAIQIVKYLRSYLHSEYDVKNVLQYYQRQIVDFIHAQMFSHQNEKKLDYEIKISKGFTKLKPLTWTSVEGVDYVDYRRSDFDKSQIGKIIFNGFSKCLYPYMKFDSDTERRFSVILEHESIKWIKPAQGQFQIHYRINNEHFEYVPDFVSETLDTIYMTEIKALKDIDDPVVLAKKEAALQWCTHATDYNKSNNRKPWKYLLIPHDVVKDNMSLKGFELIS